MAEAASAASCFRSTWRRQRPAGRPPSAGRAGSADYTATQGCEQYVAAGEQLGSLPLANQPAAVALITNAGWCIPTLGEPTLYNTAVCENGFNVGLPISGCDDAAPIAVVIDSPEVVAGWHELYWAPVSFSDQRDVDLETAINDEQLPTEVRTWWRLVSDLFQYRDNELQTAARTGTAQTGSTSWINLSVALHVEGTEECDDTIATHDGLYIDSTEGLRTTSVSPIVSDFVYSADLSELFGVYVGDSWVDLSKRDANGSFVEQFRLRHRLDNEECASWPGRVRLEYNCGP